MSKIVKYSKLFCFTLLILSVLVFSGCKGKKTEEKQPAVEENVFSMDALKPILGEAREDNSGIVDVTGDANELIIAYRYYDVDLKDYDDGLVRDLSPKIVALYREFKTLDRAVFQIAVNDPEIPGKWKSYVSFAVNRKLIEELEWSNLLTADFFRNVIDLKRFD